MGHGLSIGGWMRGSGGDVDVRMGTRSDEEDGGVGELVLSLLFGVRYGGIVTEWFDK